jgi:hypothetical protein
MVVVVVVNIGIRACMHSQFIDDDDRRDDE